MIVGNGMIAKRFKDYELNDNIIIFASGISNSANKLHSEFEREANLLNTTIKNNSNKRIIYFSTCSIYDPSLENSLYVRHKKNIESLIIKGASKYTIFRVSNPIGATTNKHTLLNYFIEHILLKQEIIVWKNASRNILDIDDMFVICNEIIHENLFLNTTVNIANPHNYKVMYILSAIEKHFNTHGHFDFIDKGGDPKIDTSAIQPIFDKFNFTFTDNYLPDLLQKFYPIS